MNAVQPRLSATLFMNTATKMETDDRAHPDQGRVIVLRIADLTVHFSGNDEEVAAIASMLQRYIEVIRLAAVARCEAAEISARDEQIDAGFGTGYIGEFR